MLGPRKHIGEILKEWGKVADKQVRDALERQGRSGRRLGEILIASGACNEDDVMKALALQFDMEFVDLDIGVIVAQVMEMVPEAMMKGIRSSRWSTRTGD